MVFDGARRNIQRRSGSFKKVLESLSSQGDFQKHQKAFRIVGGFREAFREFQENFTKFPTRRRVSGGLLGASVGNFLQFSSKFYG